MTCHRQPMRRRASLLCSSAVQRPTQSHCPYLTSKLLKLCLCPKQPQPLCRPPLLRLWVALQKLQQARPQTQHRSQMTLKCSSSSSSSSSSNCSSKQAGGLQLCRAARLHPWPRFLRWEQRCKQSRAAVQPGIKTRCLPRKAWPVMGALHRLSWQLMVLRLAWTCPAEQCRWLLLSFGQSCIPETFQEVPHHGTRVQHAEAPLNNQGPDQQATSAQPQNA